MRSGTGFAPEAWPKLVDDVGQGVLDAVMAMDTIVIGARRS